MRINWKTIFIIISIILIVVAIFLYSKDTEKAETNEGIDTNYTPPPQPSINAPEKDFIADTNYTCEDLIPERILLDVRYPVNPNERVAPQATRLLSKFKDNIFLSWGNCQYYEQVGYSIGAFQCDGVYLKTNRISSEGVILEDYKVLYALAFDDNECNPLEVDGDKSVDCKILDYSCYWEYCANKGC